jgi:GR25 family glycosyltransferase involved in LPS biosynthesis
MKMRHLLLEHILYINLESRIDRRVHVTNELNKLAPPNGFERFPAVAPKSGDGALGCTLSHIKCLELAKERNYPYVFICEDDITFLQPKVLLDKLQDFWDSPPPQGWDVLIIGGNNCPPFEVFSEYAIQVHNCQTTTGYIVDKSYYDTLITNFRESAKNLMRNPENRRQYALDIYWKHLQQLPGSRWFMIIPPTVTQYQNYSNIEERETNYNHLMLDLEKKAWFGPQVQQPSQTMYTLERNPRRGDPEMMTSEYWRNKV